MLGLYLQYLGCGCVADAGKGQLVSPLFHLIFNSLLFLFFPFQLMKIIAQKFSCGTRPT